MQNRHMAVITGVDPGRRRIKSLLLLLYLAAVIAGFLLHLRTSKELPAIRSRMKDHFENTPELVEVGTTGEIWKGPTHFNLTFAWLMNNEDICNRKAEEPEDVRLMVITVLTSRSNFLKRLLLRTTWGSIPVYKKWALRFVFLLGETDSKNPRNPDQLQEEEEEKQLHEEQKEYGDLVMGNFVDSYRNLTYKHLMGYKWILNFCPQATFVLKADDDIFLDIFSWLDERTQELETVAKNTSAIIAEYYCDTYMRTRPVRNKDAKWYVTYEEWPDEYYPNYCSGWVYGVSVSLLRKVYTVHRDVKFFWIEDVFITGVLMDVVKKKYKYEPEALQTWKEMTGNVTYFRPLCESGNWTAERKFKSVVHIPRDEFFERDMICLWKKTMYDRDHYLS